MKKNTMILAACVVAFASSCQTAKPAQPKKENNSPSYQERREKKSCGSCATEKVQEPQKAVEKETAVTAPEVKSPVVAVPEVKSPVVAVPEVKAAPAEVKVEKTETVSTPAIKVEKTN